MAKVRSGSVCNNPSSIINRPDELAELRYSGRKKAEEGEIAVFGAERYFNGVMDGESPRARSVTGPMGKPARPNVAAKFRSARSPSIHSEVSWSSRSGLLQIFPRNPAQKNDCDKRRGKSPLIAGLSCKLCSCTGGNSVQVDDRLGGSNSKRFDSARTSCRSRSNSCRFTEEIMHCKKIEKLGIIGLNPEDNFSFPILSPTAGNLAGKVLNVEKDGEEERKISFTGFETVQIQASCDEKCSCDDTDESSDLFEIESFTNNSATCYSPMEASVAWSVDTASGTEFSVAPSDSEETDAASAHKIAWNPNGKETEKRPSPCRLLGCGSRAAVGVVAAADAYRSINGKGRAQHAPAAAPAQRSSIET